ncbi:DUF2207 family protein [Micromonospora zamorensis]|uniref:DUF2207 family protein n=1 Tax=Micromonospora zamorensis TaxID=709883 RepID=UPI002ED40DCE|nr:DUF2207 domain-containing protein [Micromonospora zamorensis]
MPDLLLAGASLGLWLLAYAACRVATRPVPPAALPATMDLGPEPPAVAGLLVNGGSTHAGAAGSTLLDLAAAGYYELRQPDADPYGTTIHLAGEHPDEGGLRPYERQVLARVRELAVDGVVPLTALTFRDDNESRTWNSRLRAAVVADARAAGLSQRRFGPTMMTALYLGALAVGVVCGLVAVHRTHLRWTFLVSLTVAAVLAGLVQRIGERATPAGSEATARWLGVRSWLRNHQQFAELPPSAVAIWDRYLAYGAALGVTQQASDVLDLSAGVRRNLWSTYHGGCRRIRVRYPRGRPWYGSGTPALFLQALLVVLAGTLVLIVAGHAGWYALPGYVLLTGGAYLLIRTLVDRTRSVTITGRVLALHLRRAQDSPRMSHLVIDDGTADETTAWALPHEWGDRWRQGDVVTITVRPWSRRVIAVSAHAPADPGPRPSAGSDSELTGPLVTDVFGEVRHVRAGPLPVSVEDVARFVGQPVRVERRPQRVDFRSELDDSTVLRAAWADGTAGRIAWRANARGVATPLPGIGDEAYASGNRVVMRVGDTTLVLTALGGGRVGAPHLPWLLSRCERDALTRT